MADLLPLFPLNTVLFPGMPLPLHIFEERYRILMGELAAGPGPQRFGVVGIRQGLEAGDDDPELYDLGCVAQVRRVERYDDGRYDIVTYGGPRFRLLDVDDSRPYLLGSVDYLADEPGEGADARAALVRTAFAAYWAAVAAARDEEGEELGDLPDDPVLLSYLVAAALQVDLPDKQALLGVPDAASRLRAELTMLRRDTAILRRWVDDPPEIRTEGPFSLN